MPIKKEKLYDQITVIPKTALAAKTETKPVPDKQTTATVTQAAAPTAVPTAANAAANPSAAKSTAAAPAAAPAAIAKPAEVKPAASVTGLAAVQAPPAVINKPDTTAIQNEIKEIYRAAEEAAAARADNKTEAAVLELMNAEEKARAALGNERSRVAIDEAKALDNAALYASIRGDNGGIGNAQYNYIMGAAEGSRARISAEQRQLAYDTATEINALRASGEYEKADALLELAQDRLSKLTELYKWSEDYNFDQQKLDNELSKWRAEFDLKKESLAAEKSKTPVTKDATQLFEDMRNSNNLYTYLTANAGSYGIYSGSPTIYDEIMSEYRLWLKTR